MNFQLTEQQRVLQQQSCLFTAAHISPMAGRFDEQRHLPRTLVDAMADKKYLAPFLSTEFDGLGCDMLAYGLLNEAIGKGCTSARSLITVHSMVAYAINRWGSQSQKIQWLPKLATGRLLGAFALSEPEVGSDGAGVKTQARLSGKGEGAEYVLNGHKKWISFGQIADVFLLVCQLDGKPLAVLVERDRPGLRCEPINDMMGCRASMLSHVYLENCRIPKHNLIGGPGFGFSAVALSALSLGRFSVATGSVGMAQACMEASFDYGACRQQFEQKLLDFQLIRRMLANMKTNISAARALCHQAARCLDQQSPQATEQVMMAKYFASTMVNDVTRDAVQIHGANGCRDDHLTSRFFRDAKIMEIIEGSNEMHQLLLGQTL